MIDKTKFMNEMCDILDIEDGSLSPDTKFRELDEWNSLTYLTTLAMIDDEYHVILSADEFRRLETPEDLMNAVVAQL